MCCAQEHLFVQPETWLHLEETMEQQDEESLESPQACVEVSAATRPRKPQLSPAWP